MYFGRLSTKDAIGAILAHSRKLDDGTRLKKGVLLSKADVAKLKENGVEKVTVAVLDSSDVAEDEAARQIAAHIENDSLRCDPPFTGRVNLFARHAGVLQVCETQINAINAIDPSITIATLDQFSNVQDGRMVATIKIIPYGVSQSKLNQVLEQCESAFEASSIEIHPYQSMRVGLVATRLPSLKETVMDKTRRVLEDRLADSQSTIVEERRTGHNTAKICEAITALEPASDLIIVFGASAISDRADVIPEAIEDAGGEVIRFGMPVDPGNLALIGKLNGKYVIGAPGCSRSPAKNGFDWILQRVLAGIDVSANDIAGMGVGGLLMEIGSRPQPRLKPKESNQPTIRAIIMAAGQSRRMGDYNKLLAKLEGESLVHHVARAATSSPHLGSVLVVTGHERQAVTDALGGLELQFADNPNFADGLSSSLKAGLSGLPLETDAALILLGDMPAVGEDAIQAMVTAYLASEQDSIIVATHDGKRGNPVLWPSQYFEALKTVQGDVGARHIIGQHQHKVVEVELGEAASFDLDTPKALEDAGGYFD